MEKLEIPDELKLENYERRIQKATFDRIDLVVSFRPGNDNIGATIKCFMEAIPAHDDMVKKIEEQMNEIEGLKRQYHKKHRLFRNLDSAWNLTLENPVDFFDYLELVPKMPKVERRLKVVEDPVIKAKLQDMFDRFTALEPICSRQAVIYETFSQARAEKDEAMKALLGAEGQLKRLLEEEKSIASFISDDHILADKQKTLVTDMFPNIHVGQILHSINGDIVENRPFDEVMAKIYRSKSPHKCEFLRYDFRFDPFASVWRSLAELREMGVCIEDPMFARINFVNKAAQGRLTDVYNLLMQGEDPNSSDLSGNTALVMAAANKHADVVELLVNAGANVNCRDKNLMTPLLFSVNRGYMEIVRQLVDMGADRDCSDKNGRNALYYSVVSGNETIVKLFLKSSLCNEPDALWGFTPLHLAASLGNIELVKFLVKFGCSIYYKDKQGRTPEQVASDARRTEVAEFLKQQRHDAPGQFAHYDERYNSSIWIGDQSSLDVRWCADADISAVLFPRPTEEVPMIAAWLKKDHAIKYETFVVDCEDTDKSAESWMNLKPLLPDILKFCMDVIKGGDANLLICDETGNSLPGAILAALLLVKSQLRIKESLVTAEEIRPRCKISLSMRRGLDQLQKSNDDKVLHRLTDKMRDSQVMSIAFH